MYRSNQFTHPLLLAVGLLLATQSASAIVLVGPTPKRLDGTGCDFTAIQDAIEHVLNEERANPADGVDPYIGVAGDSFYNEALVVDSSNIGSYSVFGTPFNGAFVQIYGNYDKACANDPHDSTLPARIGAGGGKAGNSVLEIKGSSPVHVILNHLDMTDAGPNLSGNVPLGGGINFHASAAGFVELSNVDITGNHASAGGGIYANGHAPGLTVALHAGTTIENNTATTDGGGILATGETFLYATEGSVAIVNNTAGFNNIAGGDGGGISFDGHGSMTLAGVQIGSNHAAVGSKGGGIHVEGDGLLDLNNVTLTANQAGYGAGIYAKGAPGTMNLHNTSVDHNTASNDGGGIYFEGTGNLDMQNVHVGSNQADKGGGIHAKGSAPGISVILHNPVIVQFNTANEAGGGIRVEGEAHLYMTEGQTSIDNNTANIENANDGTGGGIQVLGDLAQADIGAQGFSGAAAINGNHARNGAGIAVQQGATVRLFSTAGGPVRIENNEAFISGGGIFMEGAASKVCGFGYGINANSAGDLGGAIASANGGTFQLNRPGAISACDGNQNSAAPCALGSSCNTINGNQGSTAISLAGGASFSAEQLEMRGNNGSSLMDIFDSVALLADCLVAKNTGEDFHTLLVQSSSLIVNSCTIADNGFVSSNTASPFSINGGSTLTVSRSIVWQPNSPHTIDASVTDIARFTDAIAWDGDTTLDQFAVSGVIRLNISRPLFANTTAGDYRLDPRSIAVDYSSNSPSSGLLVDLDGNPRKIALIDPSFPYDIGAYELQRIPVCGGPDEIFCNGFDF